MNRFWKKGRDPASTPEDFTPPDTPVQQAAAAAASAPPAVLTARQPTTAKRAWRKKKREAELEPEVDLAVVLPSTDNFRTSLIMPNLSARFSMLREQDDPTSLLGKASDDSVLSPRRRSRLGDFGYNGLSDISEVASIHDSIKPPFATLRQASYTSGDSVMTDDESMSTGSIMSRARPGEGNVLFGGRQKIFKIPIGDAGSVSNLGAGESRGMRGRALYDDDVSVSAFQRLREEQKEAERQRKLDELEREMRDAELENVAAESIRSPSLSLYDEKRNTVSSTNSGPSMVSGSTVATSVTSQSANSPSVTSPPTHMFSQTPAGLERTRSRKLYEQGSDQHHHDQRFSSAKRNGSSSGRSTPNTLGQSKSSPSVFDRPDSSLDSSRAISPMPPLEKLTTFESLRDGKFNNGPLSPQSSFPRPPMNSPGDDERSQALAQAMHSSDRGKATALGTFNKPKQPFDEQQYLQRQMSLLQQQKGKPRSNSKPLRPVFSPQKANRPPPLEVGRARAGTTRTDRSWSNASDQKPCVPEAVVESQQSSQPAQPNAPSSEPSTSPQEERPSGTFLSLPEDVEGEEDEKPKQQTHLEIVSQVISYDDEPLPPSPGIPPPIHRVPPPMFQHPAMRSPEPIQTRRERRQAWNPDSPMSSLVVPQPQAPLINDRPMSVEDKPKRDSDTLNAASAPALSGLVRYHLRHPSNASSIYPVESASGSRTNLVELHQDFDLRIPSEYSQSVRESRASSEAPTEAGYQEKRDSDYRANGHPSSTSTITPAPLFSQTPTSSKSETAEADWERELRSRHVRGGSSETAYEREAFSNELAERQRAIQENLRIKVESRATSPAPAGKSAYDATLKPFGLLRNKSSRESINRNDPAPRGLGRLGRLNNASNPSLNGKDRGRVEDIRKIGPRDGPMPSQGIGRTLHSRLPQTSEDFETPQHDNYRTQKPSIGRERMTSSINTPPDSSRTSSSRDRSNSEVSSERSHFRPSKHREDEDSLKHTGRERANSTRPSPERQQSGPVTTIASEQSRVRSDSNGIPPPRPPYPGLDRKALAPPLRTANSHPPTPISNIGLSPGPSPLTPLESPYSVNATPPLSNVSSPVISTNTSLSQTPFAHQAPELLKSAEQLQTLPNASFTFPARPNTATRSKRKHTIHKSDISEPTLISSTSHVDTIALPAGASLRNGQNSDVDTVALRQHHRQKSNSTPNLATSKPLPSPASAVSPISPTNSSNMLRRGFMKGFGRTTSNPSSAKGEVDPDDEYVQRPAGGRLRIRKISSEGGGMNGRHRHEAVRMDIGSDGEAADGGMF